MIESLISNHIGYHCIKIMSRFCLLCQFVCCVLLLSSCISTRQIETTSPRPGFSPFSNNGTAELGVFGLTVLTGETELPDEVQALQFRVNEIQLRTVDGTWNALPVEINNFEVVPNRKLSRDILSTRVQSVEYDSIAVYFSDVFVLFGENAGGPISWPRNKPVKDKLSMKPSLDTPIRVELVFEPGASIARDPDCRWYFVPFWRVAVKY